jgi:hypothetical protein
MTNIQVLSLVLDGSKQINNLSAKQAAVLAQDGFIGVQNGKFGVTPKGQRAAARHEKTHRQAFVNGQVVQALAELPVGKPFRHRGLWLRMGQVDFTRSEVLNGLKAAREEGAVQSLKLSNNNFQIVWFTGDEMIVAEAEEVAAAAK